MTIASDIERLCSRSIAELENIKQLPGEGAVEASIRLDGAHIAIRALIEAGRNLN